MNLTTVTTSRKRFGVCCPPSGDAFKALDLEDVDQVAAHVEAWGGIQVLHRTDTAADAQDWIDGLAEIRDTERRAAVAI